MIDLSHPRAKFILRASALMDGVKARGHVMSVSPSVIRSELLTECLPLLAEMRELARSKFAERRSFIEAAIDECEAALFELAGRCGGGITADHRDGEGDCPVCGASIWKVQPLPDYRLVLCRECTEPFMRADEKLDSSEGFGTWII